MSSLKLFLILYCLKQIDSKLPCVCSLIDHRGRQNVVRTSVTYSAAPHVPIFLFLPHFDVICDLLLRFFPTIISWYYWNDFPISLREKTIIKLFKRAIFKYFFSQLLLLPYFGLTLYFTLLYLYCLC